MDLLKTFLRPFLEQRLINIFYHLPLAILANIFYGFPTRGLKVIGVTGTDGKTTTVNMIYQILRDAGKKVSMISTINAPGFHVTSPDPFMVQKFAKDAYKHGDRYLVLEVTSHALDQYRFWGIKFEVGVITNITHEHLDYHKTFGNYFKTKLKLIKSAKIAIINKNIITNVLRSWDNCDRGRLITFGLSSGDYSQKILPLKLKIIGEYNIENALAAMTVANVLGVDQQIARETLENFESLPGRMEEVKNSRGIKVIIDFAHTPNGLEQALKTLRSHMSTRSTSLSVDPEFIEGSSGKLISLIGCEGYRDVGKRAMMGVVAARLSDIVIITAVDPRGQLQKINRQIIGGAKKAGANLNKNFFVIDDRGRAIDLAINKLAKRGDTVGIFGKGHEESMNLDGKHEIPWSDREAVSKALNG